MQPPSQPDLQLACPVCSAFNRADFRFCPHCGHRLGAPDVVLGPWTRRFGRDRLSRLLVLLLLLAVAIEIGLGGDLWQRIHTWFSDESLPEPVALRDDVRQVGSDTQEAGRVPSGQVAENRPPAEKIASPPKGEMAAPPPSHQALSAPVELTLFDRERDVLRQVRGIYSANERRLVTTFESIRGAYSGTAKLPDNRTEPIRAVERADPIANLAILLLDPSLASSTSSPMTFEALARVSYEETPMEQRYMAEKRARAQRWDEAVTHWKRVVEMDSSLRPAIEAAFGEAYLKSSAAALQEGKQAEAHMRLLEAIEWLPERGDLRVRLAESLVRLGENREAIEQYWIALDLLPTQAPDITRAILAIYREWGNGLLRQGEFTGAANLFREALQLDGTNGELYFGLGQAEFRRLSLEVAIQAFEAAQTYAPGLRPEVEPYLTKARALLGGPQTVVINFPPGSRRIEVPVVINGRMQVSFIIDTGASMTLMPAWVAEMLGYRPQAPSEWIRIQTAGGPRRLPYAAVNRLEIYGLGVSNLPVLFGDLPGHDVSRGLLGMDFLRHFSLAVDHELGRMTLRLR